MNTQTAENSRTDQEEGGIALPIFFGGIDLIAVIVLGLFLI